METRKMTYEELYQAYIKLIKKSKQENDISLDEILAKFEKCRNNKLYTDHDYYEFRHCNIVYTKETGFALETKKDITILENMSLKAVKRLISEEEMIPNERTRNV